MSTNTSSTATLAELVAMCGGYIEVQQEAPPTTLSVRGTLRLKTASTRAKPQATAERRYVEAKKWLRATFPYLFNEPVPLAIHIAQALMARAPEHIGKRAVRRAVNAWCCRPAYKAARVVGAVRLDIDGQPAGVVGETIEEMCK